MQKRDHTASSSVSQYVLPHEGLTAAALMWTGHHETRKDETRKDDIAVVKTGKYESNNQSDSDITSELMTDGTDESNMFVIYTR